MKLEEWPEAHEGGNSGLISAASRLSDADLLQRLLVLAGRERESTVELVAHLAELDARKLHLAEGYGSLFSYCTGALRLAEHAAYNRIEAARASRRFPAILDLLADGSLSLSTVRLLAPHLRPDNFEALVATAKGRSKREVEALVARLAPRPDVAASVRKLPLGAIRRLRGRRCSQPCRQPPWRQRPSGPAPDRPARRLAPRRRRRRPRAPTDRRGARAACAAGRWSSPLAPERYRVQFTVGEATHEKLRRVQELLRREIPDGDPARSSTARSRSCSRTSPGRSWPRRRTRGPAWRRGRGHATSRRA